jgi:tRNA(Arg) A34 adenosine deaminase TadA
MTGPEITSAVAAGDTSAPGSASRATIPAEQEERHMRRALEAARRAALAGEPPIGACLVRDGEVVAAAGNGVVAELDVTAHAEMVVIRAACRASRTLDLTGCELYSTVEPCAMCRAASAYAGIARIVFGASLADLHAMTGTELTGVEFAHGPALEGGCLREESLALLAGWARRPAR